MAEPISVPLAKKSTRAILPSASHAFAVTTVFAGDVNVAPLAGMVSDTIGGWFCESALTKTLSNIAAALAVSPSLVTARPM